MTTTTKSRSSQRAYPPDFTHLIAKVADSAMKAIIEPDPTKYIQKSAVSSALELRHWRCNLTPERRRDPAVAAAFRCDVVRNRVVRDLATQFVEAYERLRLTKNMVTRIAMSKVLESSQQKGIHNGRRDETSHVHANS